MKTIHNVVLVVAAGAAGAVAGKASEQLTRQYRRRRQIRALKQWYKQEMAKTVEYADMGVDRYIQHRKMLPEQVPGVATGYTTAEWSMGLLRSTVRKAIIAHEGAQITKKYHMRLYDLKDKSAYAMKQRTEALMKEADKLDKLLSRAGYPTNILFTDLAVDLPT